MNHVEGMAINPDRLDRLRRGRLLQRDRHPSAANRRPARSPRRPRNGCITVEAVAGCALGYEFAGVNALAVAPKGGDVYATSLTSNSLTTFHPTSSGAGSASRPAERKSKGKRPGRKRSRRRKARPARRLHRLPALARLLASAVAMEVPEGLDLSPDGDQLYVTAFETGAIDVFDREPKPASSPRSPANAGCLAPSKVGGCASGPGARRDRLGGRQPRRQQRLLDLAAQQLRSTSSGGFDD